MSCAVLFYVCAASRFLLQFVFDFFFFFKQKTAYEMRISDWSSDVCSSDLGGAVGNRAAMGGRGAQVELVLAAELGLWARGHSWHTQRDAWMRLGMEAAVCAGSLAKLARDWSLMSQFEGIGKASCRERVCQYV